MYSVAIEVSETNGCSSGKSRDMNDTIGEEKASIEFSLGNPLVEHVTGIIHLYKENIKSSNKAEKKSSQLCVLAVPSQIGINEFCSFCGAYINLIKEIRFLRREKSRNIVYMVYLRFDTIGNAESFYEEYNGKPFSCFDEIVWKLVFINELEYIESVVMQRQPGETELPTCPVCLERLDENISGIITTVCNHVFHNECLVKWGDTSCPVCRHCMQCPSSSQCSICGVMKDLWICLICGHVGCGRYKSKHAIDHWQQSQHCYALELDTQRVWDYVGDGYVHRLVRSKTDGKLVEVPSPGSCSRNHNDSGCSQVYDQSEIEKNEVIVASKIDAVAFEYNHLLTIQLESQRQYFENLIIQSRIDADKRLSTFIETSTEKENSIKAELDLSRKPLNKEKELIKKCADLKTKIEKLTEEKEFLRILNERLIANQKEWKEKVEALQKELQEIKGNKDKQIQELEDENHDLIMFIEGQKTVNQYSEELSGGSLILKNNENNIIPSLKSNDSSNNKNIIKGKKINKCKK